MDRIAYLDGCFLPEADAKVPVVDMGLVGGIAVAEHLRTFRHEVFRLDDHLARLHESLELTGLHCPVPMNELRAIVEQVVAHNAPSTAAADDLGVIVFVTGGWNRTYVGLDVARGKSSTLGVHTFPLQFALWAQKYARGARLVTSSIPTIDADVLDPRIKSRSRMQWHLAEREARARDPDATALLLTRRGDVAETSAANICVIRGDTIATPAADIVLNGVSLQVVAEVAAELGMGFERRAIPAAELADADEIWLTSTPYGVLPVTSFDGRPVSGGIPGPQFARVLQAWNTLVGCDLEQQALEWSRRAAQ